MHTRILIYIQDVVILVTYSGAAPGVITITCLIIAIHMTRCRANVCVFATYACKIARWVERVP